MQIKKIILTVSLSLALVFGLCPCPVFAEDIPLFPCVLSAHITIENIEGADSTSLNYVAYRIFNGTVDPSTKTMSNISWASTEVENAVKPLLAGAKGIQPQQYADRLSELIGDTTKETILADDSTGMSIARALKNLSPNYSFNSNVNVYEDGYYVIFGKYTGTPTSVIGTSPAFVAVSALYNNNVIITPKTTLPTLQFEIQEDSTEEWGEVADHSVGQLANYRAIMTLPSNLTSFHNFNYNFYVSPTEDLTSYNADEFTAAAGTSEIFVDKNNDGQLTKLPNVLEASGNTDMSVNIEVVKNGTIISGVNPNSKIYVYFSMTSATQQNRSVTARTSYSRNPVTPVTDENGLSYSVSIPTYDYSYNMKIAKKDKATDTLLSGAQFTVQNEAGIFIGKNGELVCEQPAGTTADTAYKWTTDNNGILNINGIDADQYTITEVKAPSSYTALANPFKAVITPNYASPQTPETTASLVEGTFDTSLVSLGATESNIHANLVVKNIKNIGLPVTGEQGIAILIAAGLMLVVVGAIRVSRSKSKKQTDIFDSVQ